LAWPTRADARRLLAAFLGGDEHYLASRATYGDGGTDALDRALDLFLARPELGFVWLAFARDGGADGEARPVGACVVCLAISTSRGTLVAKLDDVTVDAGWQRRGVGEAMLASLGRHLAALGCTRIDSGCHRDNDGAWRFYERLGFRALGEERIALLLEGFAR
jgi:ribosomal protein S18 acetylase RimI-like enzyme